MAVRIIIRKMFPFEGENGLKAFFDIKVQVGSRVFGFNDLKLRQNQQTGKLYVSHPGKKGEGEGEFYDFSYTDNHTAKEIERLATASYNKKLRQMEEEVKTAS